MRARGRPGTPGTIELPPDGLGGLARWWRDQEADLASAAQCLRETLPGGEAADEECLPISVRRAITDFATDWSSWLQAEAAGCARIADALEAAERSLVATDDRIGLVLQPGPAER